MKPSITSASLLYLVATSVAQAASLRGNNSELDNSSLQETTAANTSSTTNSRRLNNGNYINPQTWFEQIAQSRNDALSCVIRQANVPNGQGLILTADGNQEVSLSGRRHDLSHQRWIIHNKQNFEFGFTNGPAYNVYNSDNGDRPYLNSDEFAENINMTDKDNGSGRQLWRFRKRPHNPTIIYDHQFEITIAGGVRNRYGGLGPPKTRFANWGEGAENVQLVWQDEIGSYNFNPITWELIDCYQVDNPDNYN